MANAGGSDDKAGASPAVRAFFDFRQVVGNGAAGMWNE
jgi:hypothetical protein